MLFNKKNRIVFAAHPVTVKVTYNPDLDNIII